MDVLGATRNSAAGKAPVLFNMNGLDNAGVAKIERSVKSARETLVLADRLQTMRNVTNQMWKAYDQLKRSTSITRPGNGGFLDISL